MSCTSAVPQVGNIGEELDLLIAQGRDFGPLRFQAFQLDPALGEWPADAPIPESAWVPMNLTGATIRGQIRKKPADTAVVAALVVTMTDAAAGRYELSLPDEVVAGIVAGTDLRRPESLYAWDLEMVEPGGRIVPLYWGAVRVHRRVTRVV